MHIAIVTTQLGPFSTSQMSADVASLADAFLADGHTVTAVAPLPHDVDPAKYSLARRLTPIVVDLGRRKLEWTRYEGLSPSGINSFLLSLDNGNSKLDESFADASSDLLSSLSEGPDWCICWGPMTAELAASNRNLRCLVHIAGPMTMADARGISSAKVVTSDGPSPEKRAVTIRSAAVGGRDRLEISDKENAKSTFQLKMGMPVKNSIPLIACTAFDKVLPAILKRNVQVVALKNESTSAMVQHYGDRLALIDSNDELPMTALDGAIAGNDSNYAVEAMLNGVIPIVGPDLSGEFLEIEPSLQSGCAYITESVKSDDILVGIGRLEAAFQNRELFKALCGRLPSYVTTWSTVAKHFLQLMEEANK